VRSGSAHKLAVEEAEVEIEAEGGRQREAGCTSDTFDKI
jgi:hypothetical protein